MELTKEQWMIVEPYLPKMNQRPDGKGRPARSNKEVLMGVLWILRTGAPWKDLPRRYPPYQTCHRRYQQWVKAGVMEQILQALAVDLKERGKIDLRETFIDGSFASAKKGAQTLAKLRRERALKSWQLQTLMVYLSPYARQVLNPMKSGL